MSVLTAPVRAGGENRDVWLMTWFFPAWYGLFGVIICVLTRVTPPPPRPDVTAADKVAFFTAHHLTIQIGFTVLLVLLGGAAMTNGWWPTR